MPGRYKEGTVHWEESRQRWRAFVSVDGRRYSKRFLSRDEALAWTQKMRLAAHDGSFVAPSAIFWANGSSNGWEHTRSPR